MAATGKREKEVKAARRAFVTQFERLTWHAGSNRVVLESSVDSDFWQSLWNWGETVQTGFQAEPFFFLVYLKKATQDKSLDKV